MSGPAQRLSKKFSIKGLLIQTLLIFIAAALLSAALYSLIRSDGITEPVCHMP